MTGEIYHVYNRGVEKRDIFMDEQDYLRFIHNLFEFNDTAPAGKYSVKSEAKPPKIDRNVLIDILAFCLMPNHFHIMVCERKENGISKFMQKLGTGYTVYFNQRHEHSGVLFQGIYKIIHIAEDNHFRYLPYYIHLNPLDLTYPIWREGAVENPMKALRYLETYRWSSYLDYIGKKNFPSVINKTYITEIIGKPEEQKKDMMDWIRRFGPEDIEEISLEQ